MDSQFAFTEKFTELKLQLISDVLISARGEEMYTQRAQWDTGASCSCISRAVIDRLGLAPVSEAIVHTPSGERVMEKYILDIVLKELIVIKDLLVLGAEIGIQGLDMLIGMDVIRQGDFAVSNFDGKTQFSFRVPSLAHIDYRQRQDT